MRRARQSDSQRGIRAINGFPTACGLAPHTLQVCTDRLCRALDQASLAGLTRNKLNDYGIGDAGDQRVGCPVFLCRIGIDIQRQTKCRDKSSQRRFSNCVRCRLGRVLGGGRRTPAHIWPEFYGQRCKQHRRRDYRVELQQRRFALKCRARILWLAELTAI